MEIRKYKGEDCAAMADLFYETVHTVNARDYTPAQLDAWAWGDVDLDVWDRSFREHITVVAEEEGKIIGFGDVDGSGYLDRLYVHKDFQGRGIASAICDTLESVVEENQKEAGDTAKNCFITHASITARPFFEKRGYRVIREQLVERRGEKLKNFVMEKAFFAGGKEAEQKGSL